MYLEIYHVFPIHPYSWYASLPSPPTPYSLVTPPRRACPCLALRTSSCGTPCTTCARAWRPLWTTRSPRGSLLRSSRLVITQTLAGHTLLPGVRAAVCTCGPHAFAGRTCSRLHLRATRFCRAYVQPSAPAGHTCQVHWPLMHVELFEKISLILRVRRSLRACVSRPYARW